MRCHDVGARCRTAFASGSQVLGRGEKLRTKPHYVWRHFALPYRVVRSHRQATVKTEAALANEGEIAVALEGFVGHGDSLKKRRSRTLCEAYAGTCASGDRPNTGGYPPAVPL